MDQLTAAHRGTWSWRRVALAASFVLNLFLVALVGGHVMRGIIIAQAGMTPCARALAQAEANLPRRDAAAFGETMRREAPHDADAARQLMNARTDLELQIGADRYNPAAVQQALTAWHLQWDHLLDTAGPVLVDALAHVSPNGRRSLIAERNRAQLAPHLP